MKKLPIIAPTESNEFSFKSLKDFANPIYLDNNATTQIDDDALLAMLKSLEKDYANPSGIHDAGLLARKNIELAREYVATFFGCSSKEIIFTSGGTESINSVFNSVIKSHYPRKHIITCKTEHSATLNRIKQAEGNCTSYLDVDINGNFDEVQLELFLKKQPTMNLLVSLMIANNETGTIHKNIDKAISLSHKYDALIHLDAVQIAGKLDLKQYIELSPDFLTISGHKFHGPKGIGVLFIKNSIPFIPSILGGSQENGYRAGTENAPGIVALGVIAKKNPLFDQKVYLLHNKFISLIQNKIPSCVMNGGGVPGTVNVGFKYVHREAMVVKLSYNGVYASVGSACANGIEPSHVLKAMNVPDDHIHGSVRFSLSKYTTEDEIERAIDIIVKTYNEIRTLSLGIIN